MDYAARMLNFTTKFAVDFPTMVEWKTGDVLQGYGTVFFTDESKMICGVRAGVFSDICSVDLGYPAICIAAREEGETLKHLLCDCPDPAWVKLQTLGQAFFEDLREISSCKVEEQLYFVNAMDWLWRSEPAGLCPPTLTTAVWDQNAYLPY